MVGAGRAGGGGVAVAVEGSCVGGGGVVLRAVEMAGGGGDTVVVPTVAGRFAGRFFPLPVVLVDVDVLVDVTGVPQYSYRPCHGVNFGVEVGLRNGTSLRLPTAACMNRCQIEAGKVGPETAIPCTSSIGISAFG